MSGSPSEVERATDVIGARRGRAVEVGERPRDLQDPVVAAHRDAAAFERTIELDRRSAARVQSAGAPQPRSGHLGVRAPRRCLQPLGRGGTRDEDLLARRRRRQAPALGGHPKAGRGEARNPELQVDAVEERPRDAGEIATPDRRRTGAVFGRGVVVAARARVGREHELEAGGKRGHRVRPVDRDRARLERLPKHVEHCGGELGGLVEEQHSVRRARRRTRPDEPAAAAHHGGRRRGVVRRLERRATRERRRRAGPRGERIEATSSAASASRSGRMSGKSRREHRLARSGRAEAARGGARPRPRRGAHRRRSSLPATSARSPAGSIRRIGCSPRRRHRLDLAVASRGRRAGSRPRAARPTPITVDAGDERGLGGVRVRAP